jgi:hypothetical protein
VRSSLLVRAPSLAASTRFAPELCGSPPRPTASTFYRNEYAR